jgi:hypothetical protein
VACRNLTGAHVFHPSLLDDVGVYHRGPPRVFTDEHGAIQASTTSTGSSPHSIERVLRSRIRSYSLAEAWRHELSLEQLP